MGAVEMEILHTVGRFDVNVCLKSIVLEPDIHIKESYVFLRGRPRELDGKGAVEILQKTFQRLLSVGPDQENIIDIAKPGEGFERCGVEVLGLQASLEKDGVGRGHASSHGCAFDLQEIMVLKDEAVHGENKLG